MFEHFDWLQAMRTSPVMLIILACSVVTVGLALERGLYFWRRRGRADHVLAEAIDAVRGGHIKEAAFHLSVARHPVGPVAAEVLRHLNDSPEQQEARLHIALSEQRILLEKHLGWLGTMGNTAPLIGLLGGIAAFAAGLWLFTRAFRRRTGGEMFRVR